MGFRVLVWTGRSGFSLLLFEFTFTIEVEELEEKEGNYTEEDIKRVYEVLLDK